MYSSCKGFLKKSLKVCEMTSVPLMWLALQLRLSMVTDFTPLDFTNIWSKFYWNLALT